MGNASISPKENKSKLEFRESFLSTNVAEPCFCCFYLAITFLAITFVGFQINRNTTKIRAEIREGRRKLLGVFKP